MINKNILNSCHNEGFSEGELYDAYKIFLGTLVSEPRLKIIKLLLTGKRNVSELTNELNMKQTAVSHNLERLKRCGFVQSNVEGKFRFYNLNEKTIKPLIEIIEKHMSQHCIHILRSTKEEK